MPQFVSPSEGRTCWHITFGTYGARLHGGDRPTVDRQHNQPQTPFLGSNPWRETKERNALSGVVIRLILEQRLLIESLLPELCKKGSWNYFVAAAESDHVHLFCDAPSEIHGKQIRSWIKRWLGQALDLRWPRDEKTSWWAEGGSNKPVKTESYFKNTFNYIMRQRATK